MERAYNAGVGGSNPSPPTESPVQRHYFFALFVRRKVACSKCAAESRCVHEKGACVCVRSWLCRRRHNHDLRHTCASLLIAQGAHVKEIQMRLEHSSITTTMNAQEPRDPYGSLSLCGRAAGHRSSAGRSRAAWSRWQFWVGADGSSHVRAYEGSGAESVEEALRNGRAPAYPLGPLDLGRVA